MLYPTYRHPRSALLQLGWNVLFGGRRSFREDARACLRLLDPPLRLQGGEHLPAGGPALIVFNHYYRPGFDAWWLAIALAASAPAGIHFGMTGELTYPGRWYAPLGRPLSRRLLRRLAAIYGFTPMPPMPPRPQDLPDRARAVRQFLDYARDHPRALLALSPEGCDNPPDGALSRPAPGVGRFLLLLAELGFPLLPAGLYEQDGALWLRFGPPAPLRLPPGLPPGDRDRAAASLAMTRIAALLPARLRGGFDPA